MMKMGTELFIAKLSNCDDEMMVLCSSNKMLEGTEDFVALHHAFFNLTELFCVLYISY